MPLPWRPYRCRGNPGAHGLRKWPPPAPPLSLAPSDQLKGPGQTSGLNRRRKCPASLCFGSRRKILRLAASGEDVGLQLAPIQFVYGTKILLKNSNLDGNMKLMIETEVPRKKRSDAVKNAVVIMNTFGEIERKAAGLIEFTPEDMLEIADLYARSRAELATMFEYLPPQEQERYMSELGRRTGRGRVTRRDGPQLLFCFGLQSRFRRRCSRACQGKLSVCKLGLL